VARKNCDKFITPTVRVSTSIVLIQSQGRMAVISAQ